jgi:hypothetical protein
MNVTGIELLFLFLFCQKKKIKIFFKKTKLELFIGNFKEAMKMLVCVH